MGFTVAYGQCHSPWVTPPPESFVRDYDSFRERMDWFEAGGIEEDIVGAQTIYMDLREFLDRWQGRVGVPEIDAALGKARRVVDQIGAALEIEYLKALQDLLEKRHSVLIEPQLFQADMAFLDIMKSVPDLLRPKLEKIFREAQGYDFDAERFYRQIEKEGQDSIEEYNQAFTQLEVNWPNHFFAETRNRLETASIENINAWKAEVAAKLDS